jgi:phosphoglycolate phosphatase-like HAD superfamily hydrolase
MTTSLPSWNDGPTRTAIVDFIDRVTRDGGPDFVPPPERIAVFDNDGTLWCEKPMPIEVGFILERMAAMAKEDAALQQRQPWKAAYERDYAWLGDAITKHYAGDDSEVKILFNGLIQTFAGWTVDDYQAAARSFLHDGRHPTLRRAFTDCGYEPMIDLLKYLEANGFANYIASGGDRDFMRPVTQQMYGIPPERVIGSSIGLRYHEDESGSAVVYAAEMEPFDDGPIKPVRIWSRVGARPIIAAGNSNGDIPMLQFAAHPSRPSLSLLVDHDDADREFRYTSGAETAIERAAKQGWQVISVRDDWRTVFADASVPTPA